jgi:hypothetical protein
VSFITTNAVGVLDIFTDDFTVTFTFQTSLAYLLKRECNGEIVGEIINHSPLTIRHESPLSALTSTSTATTIFHPPSHSNRRSRKGM